MSKKDRQNQCFRLVNGEVAQNCFAAIHKAVADAQDTQHKVLVTIGIDDDKARSLAQNRLYWGWLHEIEQQTGQDLHLYFKRYFLSAIYARDDGEFAQMAESIRRCKGLISDEYYEDMAMTVIKNISTTKANTKQFAEYLNKIEVWAYGQGVALPVPEDLRWVR